MSRRHKAWAGQGFLRKASLFWGAYLADYVLNGVTRGAPCFEKTSENPDTVRVAKAGVACFGKTIPI